MAIAAYLTTDQQVFWGDSTSLLDVGVEILSIPISASVASTQRRTLGGEYPQIDVSRVSHRATATGMRASLARQLQAKPQAILAVIQTDAETALLMPAVVSGTPLAAAAQGVITANVPFAQQGEALRCTATRRSPSTDALTLNATDAHVYAVVLGGSGTITRGSAITVGGPGIYQLTGNATSASFTADIDSWILNGVPV